MKTIYFATLRERATGREFELTSDSMTGLRLLIIGWGAFADLVFEGMRV